MADEPAGSSHPAGGRVLWITIAVLSCANLLFVDALWAPFSEPPMRPSILLVTMDHLGETQVATHPTPHLDALAAQGIRHTRAYATGPHTQPAVASLLTGLGPRAHGIHGDAVAALPAHPSTLFSHLADGDRSAITIAGDPLLGPEWGLTRGTHPALLPPADDARVMDVALGIIGQDARMVWVHLAEGGVGCVDDPEPCGRSVRTTDRRIGELIDAWHEQNQGRQAWIVVAGLHGPTGRSVAKRLTLQDDVLRIPLILVGPGFEPGRVISDPVGLPDIVPTLLAATHQPPLHQLDGVNLLQESPQLVFHETHAGTGMLGLTPLYGLTWQGGRYVEGAWGATYPLAGLGPQIATQPAHRSPRGPSARPEARWLTALLETPERRAPPRWTDPTRPAVPPHLTTDPLAPAGTLDPREMVREAQRIDEAETLLSRGLLGRAEVKLSQLGRFRDAWVTRGLASDLASARGHSEEALRHLEHLYLGTDSPAIALRLAQKNLDHGRVDAASTWLRESMDVADSPGHLSVGMRIALTNDALDDATAYWAELEVFHSDAPALPALRSALWLAEDNRVSAGHVKSRGVSDPETGRIVALTHIAAGEPDDAIRWLMESLKRQPDHVPTRRTLAALYIDLQRPARALRILSPVRRSLPDDAAIAAQYEHAQALVNADRGPQVPKRPWR